MKARRASHTRPAFPLGPAHVATLRRALNRAKALRTPRRVTRITVHRMGSCLDLSCGHQAFCGREAQTTVRVGQGWPCLRCPPLRDPGKSPATGTLDRFGARSSP